MIFTHMYIKRIWFRKRFASRHEELSKQVKLVNEAEKYQKERNKILADNKELNNKINDLEKEYYENLFIKF